MGTFITKFFFSGLLQLRCRVFALRLDSIAAQQDRLTSIENIIFDR